MNKQIIKPVLSILLTLSLTAVTGRGADTTILAASGQATAPKAEQANEQTGTSGRSDPFASSFGVSQEVQPEITASAQTVAAKPQLFIQTITLKLLNAANLKPALDKMCSENGKIGVDDNTNTLIICDTKENLVRIVAEIKKADQTPQQIVIEVIIIDVQLQNDTEIGVDWDFLSTNIRDNSYRQSMIFPDRLTFGPPTSDNINKGAAFQNVGLGSELAIIASDIRYVVHLLQQQRNVNILASPRVMVVSGQKATIETVEEIPYQELTQTPAGGGGSGAMTSTQFKKVGVTMEVKAVVTDENKIMLVVTPEQSVNTGISLGGVPIIDTRKASTTLLMDDGQVAMLGGLRRQDTQIIKKKVPLLGDLPLIGLLFSNNQKVVENSELLVLLSPHIYKGEPVSAAAMARYNKLKENSLITTPKEKNTDKSSDELIDNMKYFTNIDTSLDR
jgi:type II secretory pathway component GspD/PulD (secretin)